MRVDVIFLRADGRTGRRPGLVCCPTLSKSAGSASDADVPVGVSGMVALSVCRSADRKGRVVPGSTSAKGRLGDTCHDGTGAEACWDTAYMCSLVSA